MKKNSKIKNNKIQKTKKDKHNRKKVKEKRTKKKIPFSILSLTIMLIFLIIAIPLHIFVDEFSIYWFWFAFFVIFIPLAFLNMLDWLINSKALTEEKKKSASINICKYIGLFWLYDLLYMSIFNEWIVLEYIFGVLAIIIIFYNLTKAFLSDLNSIKWMLPFDLLLGVGLSIYLIYEISDTNLQTIVTSIVSALYGGLLTLIGVAWTIRHTNKEKKEDELRSIRPFIYPFNPYNDFDIKHLMTFRFIEEDKANLKRKYIGMIKNTENGILILKELIVDNERFFIKHGNVLDKNSFAEIILYTEKELDYKKVTLVGTDVRGYIVAFNIELSENKKGIVRITEEPIND